MTVRASLLAPRVLRVPLLVLFTLFFALHPFSSNGQSSDAGFTATFLMQPIGNSLETLSETALTVFTGTLRISLSPQTWIFTFDDIAPGNTELMSVRRWSTTSAFAGTPYEIPYSAEMSFYREKNTTNYVPSCCSQTPLYDTFTLPVLNEYISIIYAGKPVTLLLTSLVSSEADVALLNDSITMWDGQNQAGCPLKCNSPVDVMFGSDASGSIDTNGTLTCGGVYDGCGGVCCSDGENWNLIRDFIGDFKDRYFFTSNFDGARFGLAQQSAYQELNQNGERKDVQCTISNVNASSSSPSDWGEDLDVTVTGATSAVNWIQANCEDRPNGDWNTAPLPCACSVPQSGSLCNNRDDCEAAWSLLDAELSGNKAYFDYRLARMRNNFLIWYGGAFEFIQATSIGQGIYQSGKQLLQGHRGKQQILVTLTDGQTNRGLPVDVAIQGVQDDLLPLDGPKPIYVAVGVTDAVSEDTLLASANGNEKNVLRADNAAQLGSLLDRLVSLSCAPQYDLCQATCNGICSPCGDCLCPACPDLDCQVSVGCISGICQYAEPEAACCPSNIIEACERRGGEIRLEDCECLFNSGDGGDTGAVVGGTIGGLLAAVVLGVLALLIIVIGAILLVTAIILILKAQAIAAAIASLGSNAFGAGGSSSNPTYEGNTFGGDNPLFADSGL